MKNFLGQNGFVWFFGVVEDINDPIQLGRVRVRCIGWHTDDKDKIPTETLPWAIPMFDVQSAAKEGVGESPTGLLVGSWVLGFFIDGARAQEPAITGSVSGSYIEGENRFPDINALARGTQTKPYTPDSVINEPADPYAAVYPYNKVKETESGHVKEYDDTPDKERIRELHKSGTFYQVHPDGTVSTHVVKDNYKVVVNDDSLHVKGNVNIIVDGDYSLRVHGRMDITADEGEITILGADSKTVGDGSRGGGETVTLTGHHHPYQKSGGVDADPEASGPPVK